MNQKITTNNSKWSDLPGFLLEEIFTYLSIDDRLNASLVCKNWSYFIRSSKVWSHLIVDDKFLAHMSFNFYSGWQYVLNNQQLLQFLECVGHFVKYIHLCPIFSFTKLFQFLTTFTWFIRNAQQQNDKLWPNVKGLSFIFPCDVPFTDNPNGIKLFGLGGQLIGSFKQLCSLLSSLNHLKLVDLVLERYEANHLMDEISRVCYHKLIDLHVINVTVVHCPFNQIGFLSNLQTLTISPQNLNDETLISLRQLSQLKHLFIVQNRHTPKHVMPCSGRAWNELKRIEHLMLRVHLVVEATDREHIDILVQPNAPIHSIWFKGSQSMKSDLMDTYQDTLEIYGQEMDLRLVFDEPPSTLLTSTQTRQLPTKTTPFASLLAFDVFIALPFRRISHCRKLTTLSICDPITTCNVLLIASLTPTLCQFYVRRNVVTVKCDLSKEYCIENGIDFDWLLTHSMSIRNTEIGISKLQKQTWTFIDDEQYKKITLNLFL